MKAIAEHIMLPEHTHITAKLGYIREFEEYMESGEHAGHV